MLHDKVAQISSTVAGEVESDKYNFNKARSEIIEVKKKKFIGNNIMLNGVVLELGWSISKGAKAQIKSQMSNGFHRLLLVHSVGTLSMCYKKLDNCLKNYHNKSEQ